MAQPIVSPENLNQALEEIKEYIDDHSSESDYTNIYTVISRRDVEEPIKLRLYLAIDSSIDISEISLIFGRYSRVTDKVWNEDEESWEHIRHCSWHQIWAIPQNEKIPLFNLILKPQKWQDYNKKSLYEVTVAGYDSLWDFLNSGIETGYYKKECEEISLWDEDSQEDVVNLECLTLPISYADMITGHKSGIALVKDGKIISNYATFSGSYRGENEEFVLNR